jgi:hypothetical protein
LFDAFRAHALSHPLILFLLCVVVSRPVRAALHRAAGKVSTTFLVSALYVSAVSFYVAIPAYFDHVEPSIAAVSWAVIRGQEAYPSAASSAMYGLPYGPMLFLFNGLTMKLFGPCIVSSKIAGALASVGSLVLTAIAARRASPSGWPRAILLTALVYFAFGATTFWVRAEPFLLLCSSLAVLSLTLPAAAAVVVAGVALGIGVDLKISAFVYLFPVLILLGRRTSLLHLAMTLGVAAVAAAIPFVLSHNISATGYFYWMWTAAGHGFRLRAVPSALEWAIFVLIPVLSFAGSRAVSSWGSHPRLFRLLLIVSVFASLPLAAKYGTGFYHFLPFIPLVAFAAAGSLETSRINSPGMLLACVVLAVSQLPHWVAATTALPAREIARELREIDRTHGPSTAMGYSRNYRVSFFRPLLVFDGNPYALDAASLMDWHWGGAAFPAAAVDAIRECEVAVWAIPAGAPPFELPSAYPRAGDVIPEEFRQTFRERYQLVQSRRWFDVWQCRP